MKTQQLVLSIIAGMLVFGGIVRLLANERLFELFGMQILWDNHAYFIYIYRVLGAFVILTGILLYAVTRTLEKHLYILKTLKLGFIIVGTVMAVSGYLNELPFIFYAPDFIFCFTIALIIQIPDNSEANTKKE